LLFRRLTSTVRERLLSEGGFTLVVALGASVALAATAATTLVYTAQNYGDASLSKADQTALSLAEGGLNNALSILGQASDPTDASVLPPESNPTVDTSYDTGTVSWWGSYDSSSSTWTVTGRGVVRNPTGGLPITHTVSEHLLVSSPTPSVADNPAWGYIYSFDPSGCLTLNSSVKISEPLYVAGDLCLNNSSQVTATASPAYVTGKIQTTSSASVGTSGSPLANLYVGNGCRYGTTGSYVAPCTPTQHVYATTQSTTVPTIAKPPIDLAYWYANAAPGPNQGCSTGTFPGGFDTDSTMNRSLANVNLFTTTAYDCKVVSGGQTVGEISWDPGTKAFFIDGTVFVDGSIVMSGSQQATYTGRGTIYASGTINLAGSLQFCAVRNAGSCDFSTGAWNPQTTLLALVSGSTTDTPDVTLGQSMMYQGAIYAATDYTQGSSVHQQGPIIADNITLASSSQAKWMGFDTLAPGMPSVTVPGKASLVPGSWSST
jgi:hypothetical protein